MVKVKMGAITKKVPEGALKWYKIAGWKVINEPKKEEKKDKTNSKKVASA